jgi:hypothetical protein
VGIDTVVLVRVQQEAHTTRQKGEGEKELQKLVDEDMLLTK